MNTENIPGFAAGRDGGDGGNDWNCEVWFGSSGGNSMDGSTGSSRSRSSSSISSNYKHIDAAVCGMFLNEHVCSTVHRWHINVYYHWKSEICYQHYSTLNGLYDVCCTSWGHRQFQCSDV